MQPTFFLYVIVGVIWTVNGLLRPNCDHLGTLLYEDLGCTAVYEKGKGCPMKFNCSAFTSNNESCLFRGKKYQIGEDIEENLITENCFFDCKCADPSGFLKYECGYMNCTDWSESYNVTKCYKKYDVDQCCSTGIICPKKRNPDLYFCDSHGERYKEGQLFVPYNSCNKCSCKRGFRGRVEAPFCRRSLCAAQIHASEELEHFCAPLYVPASGDIALCCPDEWVCYSQNDTVVNLDSKARPDVDLFCNFGPTLIRVGDGFKKLYNYFSENINITCTCILPPLMTCTGSL